MEVPRRYRGIRQRGIQLRQLHVIFVTSTLYRGMSIIERLLNMGTSLHRRYSQITHGTISETPGRSATSTRQAQVRSATLCRLAGHDSSNRYRLPRSFPRYHRRRVQAIRCREPPGTSSSQLAVPFTPSMAILDHFVR
jgi:hypothetical protein